MSKLSLACEYAVKMSEAKTMQELQFLWKEITMKRSDIGIADYEWLSTFKDSRKTVLSTPELCENDFTKEGVKWAKANNLLRQK